MTCVCGQSFAPHYILGEPRTHCPYCHRELPQEPASEPLLAELVEVAQPAIVPVSNRSAASAGSTTIEELIRKKDALQREVAAQTQARSWRVAPESAPFADAAASDGSRPGEKSPAAQQRFLDPAVTTVALREMQQELDQHLAKRKKQACQGCELATCDLAFNCGALPRGGHGLAYVLGWTVVPAALSLIPTAVIVLPIWYLLSLGRQPSYGWLALWLVVVPLALAGAMFFYTFFASRQRRAHWRALAAAGRELELRFSTLQVAARTASPAIPVLCPGASAAARPLAQDELDAQIVLAGECAGQDVLVVKQEFRFAVAGHMSGRIPRTTPLLLRPLLLFARQWRQPLRRGYLLALFPDPLEAVPDFAIGSPHDPEGSFLRNTYRGQAAAVPSLRGSQAVVFAQADAAAPPLPYQLHELLATLEPGWSLQVSAGRLIVWREAWWPAAFWTLPHSASAIVELVQVAARIRRLLTEGSETTAKT